VNRLRNLKELVCSDTVAEKLKKISLFSCKCLAGITEEVVSSL
jgi:hypothetical protein